MRLTQQEIDRLVRLLGDTQESEIHCEQCLALVAEFAERRLEGRSIAAGMAAVEQHLAICDECREEYDALRRTLESLEDE